MMCMDFNTAHDAEAKSIRCKILWVFENGGVPVTEAVCSDAAQVSRSSAGEEGQEYSY